MGLSGQFGICIEPGEKEIDESYIKWLESEKQDEAEKIYQYVQQYGGKTFGMRSPTNKLHAHPPRIPEGILNFFAADPKISPDNPLLRRLQKSILLWCQNSHRSAEGSQVFGEVLGLMRDYLSLDHTKRIFLPRVRKKHSRAP